MYEQRVKPNFKTGRLGLALGEISNLVVFMDEHATQIERYSGGGNYIASAHLLEERLRTSSEVPISSVKMFELFRKQFNLAVETGNIKG